MKQDRAVSGSLLCELVAARAATVDAALSDATAVELRAPSALPGWSRLTIACHLRYGALALHTMTADALAGRPASYYPLGRAAQRPGTLEPAVGETAADVVADLTSANALLVREWRSLSADEWTTLVVEPADNPDLGPVSLEQLALGRLTEVEVHGTDLRLGLPPWSAAFVRIALPARVERLAVRRSNHREFDERVRGSWLLVAEDGPTYRVQVTDAGVQIGPVTPTARADAIIRGSAHEVLALLLGRVAVEELHLDGDHAFAKSFSAAFPGP